jgi:RNA polymerase sigma-70 factor (ECF subfamily)
VSLSTPEPAPSAEHNQWFEHEVRSHEAALRGFLHRRYPQLPDVDDVVQESFIKVLFARQMGKLTSVKGLLFVAAKNSAISIFRKRNRIADTPVNEMDGLRVIDDAADVVELVCGRDEKAMVVDAIGSLPRRCGQILALRLLRGMSDRTIAAELGISEQTVRVQMARGIRKCGEYLRKRGVIGRNGK